MSPSGWGRASRIRNTVVNFRRYACWPLFQGNGAGRITGKVIESIPEKCGIKLVDAALLEEISLWREAPARNKSRIVIDEVQLSFSSARDISPPVPTDSLSSTESACHTIQPALTIAQQPEDGPDHGRQATSESREAKKHATQSAIYHLSLAEFP